MYIYGEKYGEMVDLMNPTRWEKWREKGINWNTENGLKKTPIRVERLLFSLGGAGLGHTSVGLVLSVRI